MEWRAPSRRSPSVQRGSNRYARPIANALQLRRLWQRTIARLNSPAIENFRPARRLTLHCGELADPVRCGGIPKDRRSRHSWRDLPEQLQLFRTAAILEGSKSSELLVAIHTSPQPCCKSGKAQLNISWAAFGLALSISGTRKDNVEV
jgi:hypothetical protein